MNGSRSIMKYSIACIPMSELKERECPKCARHGIEKYGESLPDNGTLKKVIHDDGSECEFVEYSSISSFFIDKKETKRKERDPKIINYCPACGKKGRIESYRPNKDKQFHTWKYYVAHEPISGYWGRTRKVRKFRRCYMKTEDQRNQILKILGRDKPSY